MDTKRLRTIFYILTLLAVYCLWLAVDLCEPWNGGMWILGGRATLAVLGVIFFGVGAFMFIFKLLSNGRLDYGDVHPDDLVVDRAGKDKDRVLLWWYDEATDVYSRSFMKLSEGDEILRRRTVLWFSKPVGFYQGELQDLKNTLINYRYQNRIR